MDLLVVSGICTFKFPVLFFCCFFCFNVVVGE